MNAFVSEPHVFLAKDKNGNCVRCGFTSDNMIHSATHPEVQAELSAGDSVNHPKHYNKHPSGVECITVVEHFNFNRGNAIKYIWRAGDKGNEIEDLKKARWYLEREIERMERK